jgi:signal transduction histidine kinase
VSRLQISALGGGMVILMAFALAPGLSPDPHFRTLVGDLVPLLIITAASIFSTLNALNGKGHTKLFWSLVAVGMAMWCFNQACWVWFEVIVRQPVPEPFQGDIVLFMHIVPITAAVAFRPQQPDEREGMLPSALNVPILLVWWLVIYAFFVFPEEYISVNVGVYSPRWDFLYLVEGAILIAVSASAYFNSSGLWRELYRDILIASALYTLSSEAMNSAIARGAYKSGGIYDLPFVASGLGFLWVAVAGRYRLSGVAMTPPLRRPERQFASLLTQLALLSLPLMAYWALFLGEEEPFLRQIRFLVAMGGIGLLAFFIFLKQNLLDQRLLQLLKHSRKSFVNLQRLQGRAVQQAKLASLGELVAIAAGELEFPLSSILNRSEQMAGSSRLSGEQLATARKIGQQARRTRELVGDLLSFSQQTPGEKSPLDLKPLLQRAVQMEGFKLENKMIILSVEAGESVPSVLGNANQLLQAFLQIVENAVDALHEVGGGRLQISLWNEADEIVVQFADNGPGIRDPERVFDPFYTTKPVGKGTGLGLSATYGVVRDHKGQISCYNRPEGGAAFEIRLPAIKANELRSEAASAN